MKKLLLLAIVLCWAVAFCDAQDKWYVTPAIGVTSLDSQSWTAVNVNVGREFGDQSIDFVANYAFISDDHIFSTSILASTKYFLLKNKMWTKIGAGIGVQRIVSLNETNLIAPIRSQIGFNLSEKIGVGLDTSINSSFKNSTSTFFGGLFVTCRL